MQGGERGSLEGGESVVRDLRPGLGEEGCELDGLRVVVEEVDGEGDMRLTKKAGGQPGGMAEGEGDHGLGLEGDGAEG
jgi:hypothetical protein